MRTLPPQRSIEVRASAVNSGWSLRLPEFSRCGYMKTQFGPVVYTPSALGLQRGNAYSGTQRKIKRKCLQVAFTVDFFLQLVPIQ